MPGDRKHHSDRWRRCVEEVQAKGHDESSASAICTTSLQNAGESIFEAAEAGSAEEIRLLGDLPGHEFHGNQWTAAGAEKQTKKAEEASKHANTREKLSDQERADRHSDAAVAHRNAAEAQASAAKVAKDQTERDYHNSVAQGHHARADDHMKAAGIFATIDKPRSKVNENKPENVIKNIHKLFRRNEAGVEMELEELHLCGAIGQVRYEMLNGRRHLVVPVVALMEGVIHPVNAETPEFVSADVLRRAAASWVGKPVTLGHPKKNGTQCSATDSEIRKASGLGVIMKSEYVDSKRLLQEAWIDEEKAKQIHPALYKDLEENKPTEVSVGSFVASRPKESEFKGKPYKAEWLAATGDHLAFLPGGRGACSCEMGCGTHRAAMHFVTAESIELLPTMPVITYTSLEGKSFDDRISAVNKAVNDKWPGGSVMPNESDYGYVIQTFDNHVIVRKGDDYWDLPYTVGQDGGVMLGEGKKVKQQWIEASAKYAECETCHGLGQVKDGGKQSDCPMCHGKGKLKTAAGARHSSSDMKMIQTVHDHAVSLGAVCDRKNLETAAATPPAIQPAVRREGTKWVLYSTDGLRRLATHDTEAEARTHEQAVQKTLAKCG